MPGSTAEGAGVTVAVVDTGINADHDDLVDQIAGNAGGDRRRARRRRRRQRLRRRPAGWDFVSSDNVAQDGYGHGTHVAGTIAATGANGVGVVGVAPKAKLLPLRALGRQRHRLDEQHRRGLRLRRRSRRPVVNASLGGAELLRGPGGDRRAPETLYVVAAGNDTPTPTPTRRVPVRAAGGQRRLRRRDRQPGPARLFSNYGATAVDLFAPGVGIFSTSNTSSTAYTH